MVSCEIRIWHHLVQFLNPPQSATSCHREVIPNSCHYPEVAIQLNYNFYIIFTTEARSKAHLGQHCVTWWCLPQAVEPHRAAEPSGCSGCWVTAGLCGVNNPQRALSMSWGSRAVALLCFQLSVLCSCRWAGIWALTRVCSVSEMPVEMTEAVTAQNSANTHCTQNWNLNPGVHRTTRACRAPAESH